MLRLLAVLASLVAILTLSTLDAFGAGVAIDFEERPVPDLSTIRNVYHGGAEYIYAFLVVKSEDETNRGEYVSSYDVGYRLNCPDNSVINHGFYRMAEWKRLDPATLDTPHDPELPGAALPTVIGYWKLQLKHGRCSHAEFQLVPNPANGRLAVTFTDGQGNPLSIPDKELSQNVRSHGLINKTYYRHRFREFDNVAHTPGRVVAHFMPGVIEMSNRTGDITDIVDPGLRDVAIRFGLFRITRVFRNATRHPDLILSRTGELWRPAHKWDIYALDFAEEQNLSDALRAVLELPRCVYAGPSILGDLTGPMSQHMPDDPLAQPDSAWHLYRIKMPEAWDIGGTGYPSTRIGVADYGLDYHLEDYGGGFGQGKKIAGGWDYGDDDGYPARAYGDDPKGAEHGNWTTSVVGALANNTIGIAGVAGGWGGIDEEIGPSIYHFKVRKDFDGFEWDWMAEAIADAGPEYGCHVLSVSFRWQLSGATRNNLKLAVRDCYKSGAVLVSGLGNEDSSVTVYPGCFREDWVLCLQGSSRHPVSDTDSIPERRISGKDPLYSPPHYQWGSNWPDSTWPIPYTAPDVSAPASHMCLIFSDSAWVEGELRKPYYFCNGSGVSYAIPITAGIAGLMLGMDGSLLVPDVEGLMSASCTDILSDYEEPGKRLSNWDKYSGWGRINADSCMMYLSGAWFIEHYFGIRGGGFVADSSLGFEEMTFFATDTMKPLDGQYLARRFEVRRVITPPTSEAAPFVWGMPCYNAGWGFTCENRYPYNETDDFNLQEPFCGLVPSRHYATACTLYSYSYRVYDASDTSYYGWFPRPPEQLEWGYAGLVYWSSSVRPEERSDAAGDLKLVSVAPNPVRAEVLVSFHLPTTQGVSLTVYDIRGREVRTILNERLEAGTHHEEWDGRNNSGEAVAPGVYICRISNGSQYDVKKMVLLQRGGQVR